MVQKMYLASPRGFCAGVDRAIEIVDLALKRFDKPVFVNHEIVHNKTVVESFKSRGVIFTDDLDEVPSGAIYVFSAHGVAPSFRAKAEERDFMCIDATCPLVTKVHWEAEKYHDEGYAIFYIGQEHHQEAIGVTDVAPMTLIENESDIEALRPTFIEHLNESKKPVVVLTQTTLSVDDTQALIVKLREKIPHLKESKDLCYATQNRQDAVKVLSEKCDFIIVIGSPNSSNSVKLALTANKAGSQSELFDTVKEIPDDIFEHTTLGVTSGASVPDSLVQAVLEKAKTFNPKVVIEVVLTKDESGLRFPLPKELM